MRNNRIALLPFILIIACCSNRPSSEKAYRDSSPQHAIIYNDGEIVLEDKLDTGRLVDKSILLPATIDLETLSILQDGKRIKYFTVEKKTVSALDSAGKRSAVERYLLSFPDYDKKIPLFLRYSVNGISWQPRLDVEIKDGKNLDLTLNAIIAPGENELKDCDITLVYSNSAFKVSSDAERYDIGKLNLLRNQTVFYVLDSKTVEYDSYYKWEVDVDDQVMPVIAFDNPMQALIYDLPYMLISENIVVNKGDISSLQPRAKLELAVKNEKSVATYRKASTTEDNGKKILRFNHQLVYRVMNNRDGDILIRVYFTKRIGDVHRNVYHFPVEPTSRPGEYFVWDLKVPKNDAKEISFSYDSDEKNVREYLNYNDFDGGR